MSANGLNFPMAFDTAGDVVNITTNIVDPMCPVQVTITSPSTLPDISYTIFDPMKSAIIP
jgi:hypothetical protein